ncbi:MAG: hypothetical protein HDR48_02670 [Bacteroides sp.]|nr:hypothetical protein [Bacteroides sp.]
MKKWQKTVLLISGTLLFGLGLTGLAIIWLTPKLYSLHSWSNRTAAVPNSEGIITPTMGDLGTFGDSAGFFNAVFSGLALCAVIITLWRQITKDDKDEERNLLNQFRDHCFTLMTMLSEIVAQLKITIDSNSQINISYSSIPGELYGTNQPQVEPSSGSQPNARPKLEVTGRACFKFIYAEYPEGLNVKQWINNNVGSYETAEMTEENYQSLRKVMGDTFDHYFRTLYRILLFIKESDMSGVSEEKQAKMREHCADMLRAQLSTYELAMLYYNALYPDFRSTSKSLFEDFCLFDNLDPNILCLKSEADYYIICKQEGKNGDKYKKETHYDFKAFKKMKSPGSAADRANSFIKFWSGCLNIFRCSNIFKGLFSSSTGSGSQSNRSVVDDALTLSPDEQKVLDFLKSKHKKPLTFAEIARHCNINKGLAKSCVDKLESLNRIESRNAKNGKIYKVLQ